MGKALVIATLFFGGLAQLAAHAGVARGVFKPSKIIRIADAAYCVAFLAGLYAVIAG